jgi:DNA-binding protein Fis
MKRQFEHGGIKDWKCETSGETRKGKALLESNIAGSIDVLVDYLVENKVEDIHDLILGEVEKRVLLRVLERTRGNKRQAAKLLGMNRNTFQRKIVKLAESCRDAVAASEAAARGH